MNEVPPHIPEYCPFRLFFFYLHNFFSYNQASAGQAVLKMDGVVMADQPIAVAISNPPPRNAPMTERDHPSFVPSLGGGKKDTRCVLM